MEETTLSLVIAVVALIIAVISLIKSNKTAPQTNTLKNASYTIPLQLQAYERLVLLSERMALPNLVSRTAQPHLSAREMQVLLIENLKQEYEYNASQQIYVSTAAWDAVSHLKDQNMLIINQIANALPPDAKASDLNKQILEVLLSQKEKALHTLVQDTLNAEARKLMA